MREPPMTASLWSTAARRLRGDRRFLGAAAWVAVVTVMALQPTWFTRVDPNRCLLSRSVGRPSADAWFGYDVQGCDYFAQAMHGARASIAVGIGATLLAGLIAVVLGTLAGFRRGWVDTVISRVTDVWFAVPAVLGAIVLLTLVRRQGILEVTLVLSLLGWPTMLRLMRSSVLTVSAQDYVLASRALGAGDLYLVRRHVLPNAITPLVVYATIFVGVAITAEATLTFLGVGLRLPSISWGLMISAAQHRVLSSPHLLLFPGLLLSMTVFAFVLMGDAVRDALDPRSR